jgi:hypothetical protein
MLQPDRMALQLARPEPLVTTISPPQDAEVDDQGDVVATHAGRRTRIWELATSLHCSIIGTCLSTAELRHIVVKLGAGEGAVTDNELHGIGVMLAGRPDCGAKFLHKALDRRHRVAITRYARAKDPAVLLELWEESLKQGDIPGAYWAVLTHPTTNQEVVKRAFGDVHMLSHLLGAANRADIRRLRQLEQENTALAAKVDRQQRQLHDGFAARDQAIRRLTEMLGRQHGERSADVDLRGKDESAAADSLIRDLNRRLAGETARRERSDRRLNELCETLREKERALAASQRESEMAHREVELVEGHLAELAPQHAGREALDLSGLTLLYVGGRAHQVPRMKGLIEGLGARFLHHDGGIEHRSGLLPGLVSRADRVYFPIDCVSHDAAATIKRLCRLADKTYEPLRTASLTCLLAAVVRARAETMCGPRGAVAAG